jgi:hypothetical protein
LRHSGLQSKFNEKEIGKLTRNSNEPALNIQDNDYSAEKDNKVFSFEKKAGAKQEAIAPRKSAAVAASFRLHVFSLQQIPQ